MLKNIFLFVILVLIGISFWLIPNFREISAGVAILLFGMIALENGFKSFTEGPLKGILGKITDKFYKSFTVGVVSTALLQSSSLISVITISFLSAGLMSLHQGIGVIFGANLGTTATAWLVASLGLNLKIEALAIPMIVFGIVLYLQSNRSIKGTGNILAGLGFFFFGIAIMKEGFDAYQDSLDLTQFSGEGIWNQLVFLLIGTLATVILQSSSASMAIILTALAAGQITYLNGMSLAIGANVGTTVTSMIGAVASNVDGKRIAFAHLLFNVITAVFAFAFLTYLGKAVDLCAGLINIHPENYTLKLASFHSVFNLLGIVIMRPLVSPLEKFLIVHIHEKKCSILKPRYLNDTALAYPQASLEVMMNETNYLFEICFEAIAHGLGLSRESIRDKNEIIGRSKENGAEYSDTNIDEIYYSRIKNIYGEIVNFGLQAQKRYGEARFVNAVNSIIEANRYFVEVVKDVKDLQQNMLKYCLSENDIISNEYNNLRIRITKFIRLVFQYQEFKIASPSGVRAKHILDHINSERKTLHAYIRKFKSEDILYNGSLNQLILDNKLTSAMVTSLINDSRIADSISKHLIKAAELLYLNSDVMLYEQAENDRIA
jgi:phosphate:Na+ symporter